MLSKSSFSTAAIAAQGLEADGHRGTFLLAWLCGGNKPANGIQ
jgi:hypothetical protein